MADLEKAESLLNILVESNPDRAERLLESMLAKIELRKRLATKRAQAEPVQSAAGVDAYDMIDRFLRNNLRDDDYAEYSAALDSLYTAPQQAEPERNFCSRCGKRLADEGIHTCTPPQQSEPVQRKPLTEDEIAELTQSYPASSMWRLIVSTARAIERAHGIKEAK